MRLVVGEEIDGTFTLESAEFFQPLSAEGLDGARRESIVRDDGAQDGLTRSLGIPDPAVVVEFNNENRTASPTAFAARSATTGPEQSARLRHSSRRPEPTPRTGRLVGADRPASRGQSDDCIGEVRTYLFRSTIVTHDSSQLEGTGNTGDLNESAANNSETTRTSASTRVPVS